MAQVASAKPTLPAQFALVRELIQQAVDAGETTDIGIAVVHHGRIVWEEGFGYADKEHGILFLSDTPSSIASITKPFTTTLVTILAAEGLLSLDSPAFDCPSPLGEEGETFREGITVRMLGSHCSGLPSLFSAIPTTTNGCPSAEAITSTRDILSHYGRLAYPPGDVFEYSNIGFAALGEIVAKLNSGQLFGAVMTQRLLEPLGLRNTFYSDAVDRLPFASVGYDESEKSVPRYTTSTPPSGELYSSVHDLALFAMVSMGCGQLPERSKPILDEVWLRELESEVFKGPNGVNATFGWFSGKLSTGASYLFKGGGQPGVSAKLVLLPSEEFACVVLTNRTDAVSLVDKCCQEIIRTIVPDFKIANEGGVGPSTIDGPFVPSSELVGRWTGQLSNNEANQYMQLVMKEDGTANLTLSGRSPESVKNLREQPPGFVGTVEGVIDCRDGSAYGSRTLSLKLIPHNGQLMGRIIATGTKPGILLADLPYTIRLIREKDERI